MGMLTFLKPWGRIVWVIQLYDINEDIYVTESSFDLVVTACRRPVLVVELWYSYACL